VSSAAAMAPVLVLVAVAVLNGLKRSVVVTDMIELVVVEAAAAPDDDDE
jgi:hypothetical protein